MSDVKLLPCPLCGRDTAVLRCDPQWDVACNGPRIEGNFCRIRVGEFDTKEDAIAAWNTRTAPALTPKQAAADAMFNALTTALAAEQTRLYSLPPSDDYETSVAKDGCSARIGKYRAALAKAGRP